MKRIEYSYLHTPHMDPRPWLHIKQSFPLINERADIVASAKEDLDLEEAEVAELKNRIIGERDFFEFEPGNDSDK